MIIDDDTNCCVIAEAGHNHQGNLETCMEMFRLKTHGEHCPT